MKHQIWHNFLSIFKKKSPQKDFVFVALGDSTVEGIGASTPEKSFPSVIFQILKQKKKKSKLYNFGVNGAKIKDVLENQLQKTIELQPNLVLISIGANDVFRGTRLLKFEKQFKYLINTLSNQTQATIVVNNIPDISLTNRIPKTAWLYCYLQIRRFNKKIQNYTQKMGAIFVDLHNLSQIFKGYSELVSSDGLHPSDIGYAIWAQAILSKITPLLN